jgi:hypothetical protein
LPNPLKSAIYACLLITLASEVSATQDQTYGLGGVSTGRVSSVTADVENPFAALLNPALLGAQRNPLFEAASSAAEANYATFKNVLIDSPNYRTQSGVNTVSDFTPPGFNSILWSIGMTFPFVLPKPLGSRHMGFGTVLSGPFGQLRSFTSSTPYDFTLLRYGTSDSQFKGTSSLGIEILPDLLYAGAGLSLFITAAGAADAVLVTNNPTARLNLNVGLNTAAVAGLYANLPKMLGEVSQHISLVYRQAVEPTFEEEFTGSVQVFSGSGTIDIPAAFQTSLYYEPNTFEIDWQGDFEFMTLSVGVSYQLWSAYQPAFLQVSAPNADQQASSTQLPGLSMRNTVNPRVSAEVPFFDRKAALAAGYQYRPTPVYDLSGAANLLDTNTHVVGVSARYRFGKSELVPFPVTTSLYGQYQFFETRTVVKSDPSYIGAPGYQFGGSAYTYGLSLQAAF